MARQTKADCRAKLLEVLRKCAENGDYEEAHADADDALIEYIGDEEIATTYAEVGKWYA
jgi:hypothetical protein